MQTPYLPLHCIPNPIGCQTHTASRVSSHPHPPPSTTRGRGHRPLHPAPRCRGGRVMACAAGLMQCSAMSGLHLQLLNNSASCCKLMPATTTTRASKPRLRATASGRVRRITPTCTSMANDSNSAHTRTYFQPAYQDSPSCDSGGTEVMAAAAARAAVAAVLLATVVIAIPMLQRALLRPANQPQ